MKRYDTPSMWIPDPRVYAAPKPATFTPTAAFHDLSDSDKGEWMRLIEKARAAVSALPRSLKLADVERPLDIKYDVDIGVIEDRVIRAGGYGLQHTHNALELYTKLQRQEGKGFAMTDADRVTASRAWSAQLAAKVYESDRETRRKELHQVTLDVSMWDD